MFDLNNVYSKEKITAEPVIPICGFWVESKNASSVLHSPSHLFLRIK